MSAYSMVFGFPVYITYKLLQYQPQSFNFKKPSSKTICNVSKSDFEIN